MATPPLNTSPKPPPPLQPPYPYTSPPSSTTFPAKSKQPHHNKPSKTHQNSPRNHEKTQYAWSIPLHNKNPQAIYNDIQRFASTNKLDQAMIILDYLDQLGIPLNISTFSHLIGCCTRLKSVVYAKQIYTHVKINGLESNEFIRTKIVQMFAACGLVDDAKNVLFDGESFDLCDNVYAWNAFLRGNVVLGGRKYKDLVNVYYRMRQVGVELNEYSYSCLIKSFGGAVAFKQGLKLHALLIKNGFIGSSLLKTSLIDMYFKCRRVKLACQVFDEMCERDIVLWGAMIAGFAHNNLPKEGIKYVRWMIDEGIVPNSVILTIVLPIIGEVGALKLGKEIHAFVYKKIKYLEQPFVKSALIDMYCKCGDMSSGRKVFYKSKSRNTVSWTALMSGYISNGNLEQALRSIMWMQNEGFRPDVVSLATVLPVCTELRALRQGREIHGYLMKNGFLPNVSLTTSLMVMYSKCGVWELSRRLFETMMTRNIIAWTAFIDSCAENGRPYEALKVFRAMQLSKHRADAVTISRVLDVCSKLNVLGLGKEVHGQVLKKHIECVPFVSGALVRMYGKCKAIEKAKIVCDLYPTRSAVVVTAMMKAYGYNNYFREAIDYFDKMVHDGVVPSIPTFDVALAICEQAGFADEACRIFQLMTRRWKMLPSKEHYSIIIGLLNRIGRVEEAERYIQLSSHLDF